MKWIPWSGSGINYSALFIPYLSINRSCSFFVHVLNMSSVKNMEHSPFASVECCQRLKCLETRHPLWTATILSQQNPVVQKNLPHKQMLYPRFFHLHTSTFKLYDIARIMQTAERRSRPATSETSLISSFPCSFHTTLDLDTCLNASANASVEYMCRNQ